MTSVSLSRVEPNQPSSITDTSLSRAIALAAFGKTTRRVSLYLDALARAINVDNSR